MRFSSNGYYVEDYVKCATCGELIYDRSLHPPRGARRDVFCSAWCREWKELQRQGIERPVLKLPREVSR